MRKWIITLLVIAAVIGAVIFYFVATTPATSAGIHFPLSAADRALIATVPAEADSFALIPTAAALDGKLHANPVTRPPLEDWASHQLLPSPRMVGGAAARKRPASGGRRPQRGLGERAAAGGGPLRAGRAGASLPPHRGAGRDLAADQR